MPRIPSHSNSPSPAGNSHANYSSSSTGANLSASFNNALNNAASQQGRAGSGTTQAGAQERTIEAREMREEAVVGKNARVVEEIVQRK